MRLRFLEWTFDAESRQLIGAAGPVHISPKAFDLLAALLLARPRALSKAELKDRLWPDTAVAATNLPALVNEVRQVLGDDARQPRFIRTVQRHGYAFCREATREEGGRAASGFSFRLLYDRRELALAAGEHILGRSREAAMFVDSNAVSRHHARITVYDDKAVLEDLGSKNGTSLRGRKITRPETLHDGDDIALGSIHLTFRALQGGSSTDTVRPPGDR
ncbi:MAG TPA: FHA domain-containing protein [Vicinamibacteria bacterium]